MMIDFFNCSYVLLLSFSCTHLEIICTCLGILSYLTSFGIFIRSLCRFAGDHVRSPASSLLLLIFSTTPLCLILFHSISPISTLLCSILWIIMSVGSILCYLALIVSNFELYNTSPILIMFGIFYNASYIFGHPSTYHPCCLPLSCLNQAVIDYLASF